MTMKKIGIMGGTFDPIHNGHIMLGRQAYEEYDLDCIWYMPSRIPPHKKDHTITAAKDRLAMTAAAIARILILSCLILNFAEPAEIPTQQTRFAY